MNEKIKYFSVAILFILAMVIIVPATNRHIAVAQTGTKQPTFVRHINSSVQSSRKIQWKGSSHRLWVQNSSATNDLAISFDKGKKYWTIPFGVTDRYEVAVQSIYLRGIGASVAFELLIFQTSKQDVK